MRMEQGARIYNARVSLLSTMVLGLCHFLHAGCTLQDELFVSLEQIIMMADKRGEPYARCAYCLYL